MLAAGAALFVCVPSASAAVNFDRFLVPATQPDSLAAGDFNADGRGDLAVSSEADRSVQILLGNGNGTFSNGGVAAPTGGQPITSIAAGEMTGDQRDDFAITRGGSSNRVEVYRAEPDGTFFLVEPGEAVIGVPNDIVLGEFGGAGPRLDVAVARQDNAVSARLNDGTGNLAGGSDVPTAPPAAARAITVADFDNDGAADLAVATQAGTQIMYGTGAGTFPDVRQVGASGDVAVATADVNGDGLPDVITGTQSGDVSLAQNRGSRTFATATTLLSTGSPITAVAALDLDGDGQADIAATVGTADAVRLLFGNGGGAFTATQPVPTHNRPQDIAYGDFDLDGNVDLATANANDVTLLRARGPVVTVSGGVFFGEQQPGTESSERTIRVQNNGAPRLRLGAATLSGANAPEFRVTSDGCNGRNLAIGASCTIGVRFAPTALGARAATLSIPSNGAGAPHAVPLSGGPLPAGATRVCVNEIDGTSAADTLTGTELGDNMNGFAGADVLDGVGGNDCLIGGTGNDRLNGGEGNDTLEGNSGNDVEDGGNGRDTLTGGEGRDKISGGAGNDSLNGGSGNDTLSGGSGNDRLSGSTGNDRINGGSGKNTYSGGPGTDTISAANGRIEKIDCGSGRDSVRADRKDRIKGCERVRRTRR